jgi:hypothetical protein
MDREYLNTDETAKRLRLSPRTLEKWRVTGSGPTFVKCGRRVVYRADDVDRWAEARRRHSTNDPE